MPIPILIAGVAILAGGYGVKKGLDAKEKFDEAKSISSRAKDRYDATQDELTTDRDKTNLMLEKYGEYKVNVFMSRVKSLVDILSHIKQSSSEYEDISSLITTEEVQAIKKKVVDAIEIHHAATSVSAGVATAGGVYAAVGALGTASTGASIAGLSGAAATNATLAWLGGGAIAAGGGGMAVGTAVLGGLIAGPALLIGGLVMDSKAEEQLSAAYAYVSKVDVAIGEIEKTQVLMKGYRSNIAELTAVIGEIVNRFDELLSQVNQVSMRYRYDPKQNHALGNLITVGKALKEMLCVPVMKEDGKINSIVSIITQSKEVLRVSAGKG